MDLNNIDKQTLDNVKEVLNSKVEDAKEILGDKEKFEELVTQLKEKLKEIPGVERYTDDIMTLVAMARSYITKEYTELPVKSIALGVAGIIYIVMNNDLINDDIPVLGRVDDIACIILVLTLMESDLNKFKAWQAGGENAAPAEA